MSQQPPAHRIDAKVREYLRHCEQKRLARKSIEFYTLKLQNFTRWCEQHSIATLADITSEQAREFFYNYGNTHNPGGTHAVFRTVRAWVNWCRNTHALDGWQPLKGAELDSFGDHRLAMALAVAGLVAEGETLIGNAECVEVSFPGFFEALAKLRD